jgi:hypothetical protein
MENMKNKNASSIDGFYPNASQVNLHKPPFPMSVRKHPENKQLITYFKS